MRRLRKFFKTGYTQEEEDITKLIIAKVLPRLHREARKALGPGPIYLWWDRASCHRSKASMAAAASIFDGVILQPPKSPDMNIMDAAVFPWMERIFAKSGAKS